MVDAGLSLLGKKIKKGISSFNGLAITLTSNEIKDIIKAIKSLENRGILLQGTTRRIISQKGEFLNCLRPLMTAALPLMKCVLTPFAKIVLLPLGLSAGISAADVAIENKIYESGSTALIISNKEVEDIMKIVKSLEESGLLIKGISETIKNEGKQQKGGFLPMLFGTLAASMLGSALTGKEVIRAGEGTIRAGEMLLHPLTNFEIQKCYQNKPKLNGIYSRNNLSKANDGTYIINLDEYESRGAQQINFYVNGKNVTYFELNLNIFQKKLENSLETKML